MWKMPGQLGRKYLPENKANMEESMAMVGGWGGAKTKTKTPDDFLSLWIQPYLKVNFGTSAFYEVNNSHSLFCAPLYLIICL